MEDPDQAGSTDVFAAVENEIAAALGRGAASMDATMKTRPRRDPCPHMKTIGALSDGSPAQSGLSALPEESFPQTETNNVGSGGEPIHRRRWQRQRPSPRTQENGHEGCRARSTDC